MKPVAPPRESDRGGDNTIEVLGRVDKMNESTGELYVHHRAENIS
jgi:hypothetical protein